MESGPSAPPFEEEKKSEYSAIDALIAYSNKQQGYNQNKEGNECVKCGLEDKKQHIIKLSCNHSIHFKCSNDWIVNGDLTCRKCEPVEITKKISKEEDEDIDNGLFPVTYGEDPIVRAKYDKKYKLDEIRAEEEHYKKSGLTQKDISNILGATTYWVLKSPKSITFRFLKEQFKDINDIVDAKVSVVKLYHFAGINEFHMLKELGLTKDHLKTEQFDIKWMYYLYQMNFNSLKRELNLRVSDAISYCAGRPEIMLLLGLNGTGLMLNGLTQKTILQNKDAFSKKDWLEVIKLKKEHLVQLKVESVFFEYMGWNVLELISELKISQDEMDKFHINVSDFFNKSRSKRRK